MGLPVSLRPKTLLTTMLHPKPSAPGVSAGWRRGLVGGLVSVCATLCFASAHAEIRFETKADSRSSANKTSERFSLDVRDETITDVVDELAERYEFEVDGYPDHWSKEPMSFSATGDLERVLRSLLKDTSHVFEYHTNVETKETRIAKLKLLNEGVQGFIANTPTAKTTISNDGGVVTQGTGNRRPGSLSDRVSNGLLQGQDAANTTTTSATATNSTSAPPAQVSGISRTLEQRARQSSGADTAASGSSAAAPSAPIDPSAPNADMQALTQKALQDVRGLAEALRKAENGSQ